jgi:hypothetical protein
VIDLQMMHRGAAFAVRADVRASAFVAGEDRIPHGGGDAARRAALRRDADCGQISGPASEQRAVDLPTTRSTDSARGRGSYDPFRRTFSRFRFRLGLFLALLASLLAAYGIVILQELVERGFENGFVRERAVLVGEKGFRFLELLHEPLAGEELELEPALEAGSGGRWVVVGRLGARLQQSLHHSASFRLAVGCADGYNGSFFTPSSGSVFTFCRTELKRARCRDRHAHRLHPVPHRDRRAVDRYDRLDLPLGFPPDLRQEIPRVRLAENRRDERDRDQIDLVLFEKRVDLRIVPYAPGGLDAPARSRA